MIDVQSDQEVDPLTTNPLVNIIFMDGVFY